LTRATSAVLPKATHLRVSERHALDDKDAEP
jgi:hypothetical protein